MTATGVRAKSLYNLKLKNVAPSIAQ